MEIAWIKSVIALLSVLTLVGIVAFYMAKAIAVANQFKEGLSQYQAEDYVVAERIFREVIAKQQSNDMARLLLGNALMQQNQLEEAIAVFKELLNQSPKNVDGYVNLGKVLMRQGKLNEAIATFKQATETIPKSPDGYRVLGLALQQKGDTEAAIANLTKAKAIYQAKNETFMEKTTHQDIQQITNNQ
ncbi:MAG: tetratricopeptide repeat protein [Halothece sp.]